MTETNKKPEPAKKAEKKVPDKKASANKAKKNNTPSNAGVYLLIIIVIIASAAGFYYLWHQQQLSGDKQRDFSATIEQKLTRYTDNLTQQQIATEQKTEAKIENLYSDQSNLHENLSKLIQNNKQLRKDWLLAEAEYLIQLANHRLLLEKDVATAVVALKAADKRLAEISDPALLNIRGIIAKDIQKLSNIKVIDIAGLSATISALSDNIVNLPLNTPKPDTKQTAKDEKNTKSSEVKSLKDLPAAIWQDIKGLVVIRNHQKPIQPLLSSSQHFYLTQNLALLLEQSRLALLNRQNAIYQERLSTTRKWISQYFDTEHNVTRNMLSSIDELQKNDITPNLPDISATFSIIKQYRLHGKQPKADEG